MQELQDQLQRLQDAKESMCRGSEGGKNKGDGPGGEGVGSGRRPDGKEEPTKHYEDRAKVEFDPKGKKIFDGYAPGENFKKRTQAEMEGEIKQASQEAPQAVEQQRIPKAARDMAKGYFKNLGGQDNKPGPAKKPDKPPEE